ncbi:MAG TPA: ribonuclease P protein component [Cyclobacteriaceae bacterium]|nr:ribonuclease P protein component [Cyclobacteriaceae bacterium]
MGDFSFRKHERLSKEIWIKELFEKGSSFYSHPFKVLYLPHPDSGSTTNQVLFSVPKRQFKRAVDRNTIKRRLREAYRLNKSGFRDTGKWLIAYIYTAKTILPSETFQQKVLGTIQKITSLANEEG